MLKTTLLLLAVSLSWALPTQKEISETPKKKYNLRKLLQPLINDKNSERFQRYADNFIQNYEDSGVMAGGISLEDLEKLINGGILKNAALGERKPDVFSTTMGPSSVPNDAAFEKIADEIILHMMTDIMEKNLQANDMPAKDNPLGHEDDYLDIPQIEREPSNRYKEKLGSPSTKPLKTRNEKPLNQNQAPMRTGPKQKISQQPYPIRKSNKPSKQRLTAPTPKSPSESLNTNNPPKSSKPPQQNKTKVAPSKKTPDLQTFLKKSEHDLEKIINNVVLRYMDKQKQHIKKEKTKPESRPIYYPNPHPTKIPHLNNNKTLQKTYPLHGSTILEIGLPLPPRGAIHSIVGATALGALALGAIAVSPLSPAIFRRHDIFENWSGKHWLDNFAFWRNDDEEQYFDYDQPHFVYEDGNADSTSDSQDEYNQYHNTDNLMGDPSYENTHTRDGDSSPSYERNLQPIQHPHAPHPNEYRHPKFTNPPHYDYDFDGNFDEYEYADIEPPRGDQNNRGSRNTGHFNTYSENKKQDRLLVYSANFFSEPGHDEWQTEVQRQRNRGA